MPDIFSRTITDGGQQSADVAVLTLAGAGSTGLTGVGQLVQNLNLQYQQNIQRFYDLSSNQLFYVGGRTQGTATMGQLLGPATVSTAMYDLLGNVCNAGKNNIEFKVATGCGTGASAKTTYSCTLCVMSGLQIQVQAEQMVIQHNATLTIGSLAASQVL